MIWIKIILAVFGASIIGWWAWQCAQMADDQRKRKDGDGNS